jgi:hypothetical protein
LINNVQKIISVEQKLSGQMSLDAEVKVLKTKGARTDVISTKAVRTNFI